MHRADVNAPKMHRFMPFLRDLEGCHPENTDFSGCVYGIRILIINFIKITIIVSIWILVIQILTFQFIFQIVIFLRVFGNIYQKVKMAVFVSEMVDCSWTEFRSEKLNNNDDKMVR